MFDSKPSETIKLFQLLTELKITSEDFNIPKEPHTIVDVGNVREEFHIIHKKYLLSFMIIYYKNLRDFSSGFGYSCSPGKIKESDVNLAVKNFDGLLHEIRLWHERFKIELIAEQEKDKFFENEVSLPGINFKIHASPETEKNLMDKMKDIELLIFELTNYQADELKEMDEKLSSKLDTIQEKLNSVNWNEIIIRTAMNNIPSLINNPAVKLKLITFLKTHNINIPLLTE